MAPLAWERGEDRGLRRLRARGAPARCRAPDRGLNRSPGATDEVERHASHEHGLVHWVQSSARLPCRSSLPREATAATWRGARASRGQARPPGSGREQGFARRVAHRSARGRWCGHSRVHTAHSNHSNHLPPQAPHGGRGHHSWEPGWRGWDGQRWSRAPRSRWRPVSGASAPVGQRQRWADGDLWSAPAPHWFATQGARFPGERSRRRAWGAFRSSRFPSHSPFRSHRSWYQLELREPWGRAARQMEGHVGLVGCLVRVSHGYFHCPSLYTFTCMLYGVSSRSRDWRLSNAWMPRQTNTHPPNSATRSLRVIATSRFVSFHYTPLNYSPVSR